MPATARILAHGGPLKQKRALARLRLGAAPIRTNQTHAVPFSQRRCTRCSRGVDTEHHLMFDCRALPEPSTGVICPCPAAACRH